MKEKLNFAAYNDKKVYLQATETMDIRPVKNVSENILNQLDICWYQAVLQMYYTN